MKKKNVFFFFNDTATTEIYTLSLHDALPISLILRPKVQEASQKQDDKAVASTSTVDSEGLEPVIQTKVTEKALTAEIAEPETSDIEVDENASETAEDGAEGESKEKDDDGEKAKRPFDRWSLRRSRNDRVVAGVCGGLAVHMNIDSTIIRLGWVFLSLASLGLGVIAYIVLYFAVSEEEG